MGHPMAKKGIKKRGEKFFRSNHNRKNISPYNNYQPAYDPYRKEVEVTEPEIDSDYAKS